MYLSPADQYHRLTHRPSWEQKTWPRGLSWPPSGPLTPGDALEASRVDARRLLRSPPLAASHPYGILTPPRAGATAAHGSTAPRAASRRDPSVQRPWPVSVTASAWRSHGHGWAGAAATVGANWHAGGKNYSTCDTTPAAGVNLVRLCTASSPVARPPPHAGGS